MIRYLKITGIPIEYEAIETTLDILGDTARNDEGDIELLIEEAGDAKLEDITFYYQDTDNRGDAFDGTDLIDEPCKVEIDNLNEERYWMWSEEEYFTFLHEVTWEEFLKEYSLSTYLEYFPSSGFKQIYD